MDNYLSDRHAGLPEEMVVAILNNLPRSSILAAAGADKRMNALAWKILFEIEFVPALNASPEAKALFERILAAHGKSGTGDANLDYKAVYAHTGRLLARAMAAAMVDGSGPFESPVRTCYTVSTTSAPDKVLFVGCDMAVGEANLDDAAYYVIVEQYIDPIVRKAEADEEADPAIDSEEVLPPLIGELLDEDDWQAKRAMLHAWQRIRGASYVTRRFARVQFGAGLAFRPCTDLLLRDAKLRQSFVALQTCLHRKRLTIEPHTVPTPLEIAGALEDFFFDLIGSGYATVSLSVVTGLVPPFDLSEGDDLGDLQPVDVQTISFQTGAVLVPRVKDAEGTTGLTFVEKIELGLADWDSDSVKPTMRM